MKKNKVYVYILAITVTVVLVVSGLSYAYFVATGNVDNTSTSAIQLGHPATVAGDATNCTIDLTALKMSKAYGSSSGTAIATEDCTISLFTSPDSDETAPTICSYDITYTPTSPLTVKSPDSDEWRPEIVINGHENLSNNELGRIVNTTIPDHNLYNVTEKIFQTY